MFDCDRRNTGRRKRHEKNELNILTISVKRIFQFLTLTYLLLTWNIDPVP
jgi:hypothetical protein